MIFSEKSRQIGFNSDDNPGFSTQAYKYFTPENRDGLRCGDVLLLLNIPSDAEFFH